MSDQKYHDGGVIPVDILDSLRNQPLVTIRPRDLYVNYPVSFPSKLSPRYEATDKDVLYGGDFLENQAFIQDVLAFITTYDFPPQFEDFRIEFLDAIEAEFSRQ